MPETTSDPAPATPPTTTPPASTPTPTEGEPKSESLLGGEEPGGGAPDKYEVFTVPEGFTLDEEVSKEANDLFKSSNLSQSQAQKMVDFYVAKTKEAFEAPFKAYEEMREGWRKETKADPEIGPKLAQVKTTVHRALDSLGDPSLKASFIKAMDETGMGDNPVFIKAIHRLAMKVTEGTHVQGNGPPTHVGSRVASRPSLAEAIYGSDGPRSGFGER
jgi:antitoxin component of RelBE/YafQ-DinJ toxin-antitoxin module